MSGNGRRRPPRPRIEVGASTASPEEAAAIAAALEQFLAETAPVLVPEERQSPWLRAALLEGVSARQAAVPPEPGSGFPLD